MRRDEIIDDSDAACLRRLVGDALFDRLVSAVGGVRLYVPKYGMAEDDPIIVAVGKKHADAIVAEFGGSYINLPVRLKDQRANIVLRLTAEGASMLDIVREAGIGERRVRYIQAQLRSEGKLPARRALASHQKEPEGS